MSTNTARRWRAARLFAPFLALLTVLAPATASGAQSPPGPRPASSAPITSTGTAFARAEEAWYCAAIECQAYMINAKGAFKPTPAIIYVNQVAPGYPFQWVPNEAVKRLKLSTGYVAYVMHYSGSTECMTLESNDYFDFEVCNGKTFTVAEEFRQAVRTPGTMANTHLIIPASDWALCATPLTGAQPMYIKAIPCSGSDLMDWRDSPPPGQS